MDTVDRIFDMLDKMPIEQQEFAKRVGVSDDTASNWRRRKSASYAKYLSKIAEVLGTSVEYLLMGKEKEPAPASATDFWVKFNSLTPEGQKEVIAFIEFKRGQESQS